MSVDPESRRGSQPEPRHEPRPESRPGGGPAAEGGPLVFLIAGEPSGDAIGARLMAALRAETGGRVRFAGVGGERMAAEGLDSLFPIDELAVMGLLEVLPHLRRILRRIRETVAAAAALHPAAVVTIDSPSFTLEVSQRLKGRGIALIHYVAPSVWAWKSWRARHIARYLDHLLALLPFEPPYFEKHGLATTFVGYPAVESVAGEVEGKAFRDRHGIAAGAPLLCVLPGSRRGEISRLLPVFGEAVARLHARFRDLRVVVPTVATVAERVVAGVGDWSVRPVVVRGADERSAAYAACDAALAASGTVAVELAASGCPAVIAYRLNAVSAFLARRLLKIDFVSTVNLVLGRAVQPEFLQQDCTPEKLVAAVAALLTDEATRGAQLAGYREAVECLGGGGEETPSQRAARAILDVIGAAAAPTSAYNTGSSEEAS